MKYIEEGQAAVEFYSSPRKRNIFFIGDSITQGYCGKVKSIASDFANVYFPSENCRSTQYVIVSLLRWSNMFENKDEVDTVCFNCGHWDIAHWNCDETPLTDIDTYSRNIRKIIIQLKRFFTNAKIVFITTTPMNPEMVECVNPRTTEEIIEYNKAALKVCEQENINVFDLFKKVCDWPGQRYTDYAHFTDESFDAIANTICEYLHLRGDNNYGKQQDKKGGKPECLGIHR